MESKREPDSKGSGDTELDDDTKNFENVDTNAKALKISSHKMETDVDQFAPQKSDTIDIISPVAIVADIDHSDIGNDNPVNTNAPHVIVDVVDNSKNICTHFTRNNTPHVAIEADDHSEEDCENTINNTIPSGIGVSNSSEITETSAGNEPLEIDDNCKKQGEIIIESNVILKSADITQQMPAVQSRVSKNSALSLLTQYTSDEELDSANKSDSDNDDDTSSEASVVEVPLTATSSQSNAYRDKVVEIISDTDSDTESTTSSEASMNRSHYLKNIRDKIENIYDVDNEDNENDDDNANDDENNGSDSKRSKNYAKNRINNALRVKGELLLEDLPPIEDLHISVPEKECVELGQIQSIVEQLVIVNAHSHPTVLDLDTILFLEKGQKVLGAVFDVLGQISDPLYCVRFNSKKQIDEKGIKVGDKVYTAPKTEYTKFVILANLMQTRGSDASWDHDIEPPAQYIEYSDDEEEQAARRRIRNKNRKDEQVNGEDGDNAKRLRDDALSFRSCSPVSSLGEDDYQPRFRNRRGRGGDRMRGSGGYSQSRHSRGGNRFRRTSSFQYRPPPMENFNRGNCDSWHSNYPNYTSRQMVAPLGNPIPQWRLPPPPLYANNQMLPPLLGLPPPPIMPASTTAPPPPLGYVPQYSYPYVMSTTLPPPQLIPNVMHRPPPPNPPGEG